MELLRLFQQYWRLSKPEQWRVVFYLFWHTVSVSGSLLKPFAFAMALNCLQTGDLSRAGVWLIWYVSGFALFELGHRVARATEIYLAFRNRKRFILSAYDALLSRPLSWHADHHSGNTINRINKAAGALLAFGQNQDRYIEVLVSLSGSVCFLWTLSPTIALTGIGTGIVSVLMTKGFYRKTVPEYRRQNELYHSLSAAFMDYITNITTILVLRLGQRARGDLERRSDVIFPHVVREHRLTQVKCFSSALLVVALHVGMIVFYIHSRLSAGTAIMLGSIAAIFQYLDMLMNAFGFYSFDYESVIHWWQDYRAAREILHGTAHDVSALPPPVSLPADWRTLVVDALSFAYGPDTPCFHYAPVELSRGLRIAFVGESGSGKSTYLMILRGLLPVSARITADGGAVYPVAALGSVTTLMGQEPEIFENTVAYNITLGLPAAEEEIRAAAEIAGFDSVAEALPHGYETDVREKGVNLSGGEKQRLALARGVFAVKDSRLILLDEPTGSLDVRTETDIYRRLFAALEQACVVSTLHKLHLIGMFDMVYVFENGRIVEHGPPDALKAHSRIFARMWRRYQNETPETQP